MRTMTISLGMAITLACSPVAAALLDAAAEPPARSLPAADRYDDPDPAARYVPLSLTTIDRSSIMSTMRKVCARLVVIVRRSRLLMPSSA